MRYLSRFKPPDSLPNVMKQIAIPSPRAQGSRPQGVVGVGVRGMVVSLLLAVVMAVLVTMVMGVLVVMAMGMVMAVGLGSHRNRHAIGLAGPGALPLAEVATVGEALHVVVMAVLGGPHFGLKPQNLRPVFAEGAVHVGVTAHHLGHPLHEGVEHQGVIREIGGLHELHLRMVVGDPIGVLLDAAHQHP
jgi:hypothetical protein